MHNLDNKVKYKDNKRKISFYMLSYYMNNLTSKFDIYIFSKCREIVYNVASPNGASKDDPTLTKFQLPMAWNNTLKSKCVIYKNAYIKNGV